MTLIFSLFAFVCLVAMLLGLIGIILANKTDFTAEIIKKRNSAFINKRNFFLLLHFSDVRDSLKRAEHLFLNMQ